MSKQDELARMRQLMTYGTAQKKSTPAIVEGVRKGADGKSYAVIREGAYYYLEESKKTGDNLLKEDFDYVGGFMERSKVRYNSYTDAVKNLNMKLASIQEAYDAKGTVISSADGKRQKTVLVTEGAADFRKMIERQREIMLNVEHINEGYMVKPKGEEIGKPGSSEPFDASKAEENSGGDTYKEDAKEEPLNKDGEPSGVHTDTDNDLKEVPGASKGVKPGMKPVMKEGVDYTVEDPEKADDVNLDGPVGEEPVLDPAVAAEEPVLDPDAAPAPEGEPAAAPAEPASLDDKLSQILAKLDTITSEIESGKYGEDDLFPEKKDDEDAPAGEDEPKDEPTDEPAAEPDAAPADEPADEPKKEFNFEESVRRNLAKVIQEMNEAGPSAPFEGSPAEPQKSADPVKPEFQQEAPAIENEEEVIDLTQGDY